MHFSSFTSFTAKDPLRKVVHSRSRQEGPVWKDEHTYPTENYTQIKPEQLTPCAQSIIIAFSAFTTA
jgi:hypothetical protein